MGGASRSEEEVLFQGTVKYTCDRGHTVGGLATLTTEFTRTCLSDGSFSQSGLVCLPKPCGVPPHAFSASRPDVAVVYGQTVTYTCLSGFATNPKDVSTTTSQLSCEEDGFVPRMPETCSPVVCNKPEFQDVERVTVSVGCDEVADDSRFKWITLDARITYNCGEGFTITGETSGAKSVTAVCGASGDVEVEGSQESLPTSICHRVRCGKPAAVIHAQLRLEDDGQKAVYTCDAGYATSEGKTTFETQCEATGHFSPVDQCQNIDDCRVHTCGPHGTCVDGVNSYSCDCAPGFEETDVDGEKVCGNIDDCGGVGCGGYGTCVDLVDGYRCQCSSGFEQITQGNDLICAAKSCGNVSVANSRTPMPLSLSYPESQTIQCAEGYSTDSSRSAESSSFVVECTADGSLINVQACQPVQCNAMPPMKYINPMVQVQYVFGQNAAVQCMDGYSDDGTVGGSTSFSTSCLSDGSWTLSDCSAISCGSFSSPSNGVATPAHASFAGLVHVSCDAGHSLTQASQVREAAYTCTSSGVYDIVSPQGVEISNTPTCYPVSCGVPPTVLNATADRTSEVTFGEAVTFSCDEGTTDGGVFDGNTFFTITCSDGGSFSTVSTCSVPTFSFVAVVKDATTGSSLSGALISWTTVSRSGTATTSETGATLVGVPSGPVKLVAEHSGYTPGEQVIVYPETCEREVPLIMSPVMQATGWRIVLTWSMEPLDVDLHVYWGTTSNPLKYQVYYRNKCTPLMTLDVDDRFSEGPETVTIPDWPSCRVDGEACKLLVKVNNYSRQPQMTDVKIEMYNGEALKKTFKVTNGQALNPASGEMESVSLSWWPAALLSDGTVQACHPTLGCVN